MAKAQPDHYYHFDKPGAFQNPLRCMRCNILRTRGPQTRPQWSTDGGKTWTYKHTACPFKKIYPLEKPMADEPRLGPSAGDAVVKEMEEEREKLFSDINKKLHGATVTEIVTYEFGPSEDAELTCIICGKDKCDLESTAYQTYPGFHGRVTVGKHSTCVRKPIPVRT